MRKEILLLRRFKFLDATDRAILYTCVRIHAYAWTSGRDESKFDGRCYNLRENLVEIVRESSRGTLDLRFAGYRCRTSKEERSSRSLAEAMREANDVLSLPSSLSLTLIPLCSSLFPHFHPLAISCCFCFSPTTARKRGSAAVAASLAIGRIEKRNATNAEAPTQRRAGAVPHRKSSVDETSLTEFGKASPG